MSTRATKTILSTLAVALTLTLASCGSTSSGSDTAEGATPTPTTTAEAAHTTDENASASNAVEVTDEDPMAGATDINKRRQELIAQYKLPPAPPGTPPYPQWVLDGPPQMSPAAAKHNDEGAKAFIEWYVKLKEFFVITRNYDLSHLLESANCNGCSSVRSKMKDKLIELDYYRCSEPTSFVFDIGHQDAVENDFASRTSYNLPNIVSKKADEIAQGDVTGTLGVALKFEKQAWQVIALWRTKTR